ncbi:MAG: penicillin acylase family protein, partial [Nitriliruptorales bacterium]|nr:penicillin acylase family protein [Nitriliruptorales bacterium]
MGRLRRTLQWAVIGLIVLLIAGAVFVVWTVRRSFPTTAGTIEVEVLDQPVTVLRDEWGIPHVYADSMDDLARGQGFVHAQDRFWEMDVRRHVTAGRLSEMFGESQLDTDRFIRTLGWRRVAEQEYELLSEETRTFLERYAEGVNAYLADRSGAELSFEYAVLGLTNSGYEPEPWGPVDSLAWLKAMAWDLRSNLESEIERSLLTAHLDLRTIDELYPSYPYDRHPTILSGGEVTDGTYVPSGDVSGSGLGSNSWAVSGKHTATGGAMLANDPHLEPSLPGIWYQMGLHCRNPSEACPLDAVGYTFSGVPGIIIGHNDRIAWGFTNLASDVTDLYVEKIDGDQYLFEGEWRDLETVTETIEVAGGEPVELTVRYTHHGPLLSDASSDLRTILEDGRLPGLEGIGLDGHAIALRWTALEPSRTADAIIRLNTAQDFADFREAAELFTVPSQNLLYADVDGHIGYQAPGRHPIRTDQHNGRYPVAGWTGENEWQGFIPFEELPWEFDPPAGYIATANEPVVGPEYAHPFPGDWAVGFRAVRINELLQAAIDEGDVTLDDLARIQGDNENLAVDILIDALMAVDLDGRAARARDLLEGWDSQQDMDSAAGAYFQAVLRHVHLETFADELPDDHHPTGSGRWWLVTRQLLQEPDNAWWDDTTTEETETRDDILRRAMVAADDELVERLGDDLDSWRWGELHTLTLTHGTLGESGIAPIEWLFNRGPVETAGSMSVVNATAWNMTEGYEVTAVPSMRMLVDLGDFDRSRWINLTGQSGHAYHGHYTDQVDLWRRGETTPMWFGRTNVEDATTDTLT